MQIIIQPELAGMCVRQVLLQKYNFSTKMLKHVKYHTNGILVNNERCTVRRQLAVGDILTVCTEDLVSSPALEAVELPLQILYEDDDLVIPSKPAEMPTHPSHGHTNDTVANALAYRYLKQDIPFVFRPINRLDRNTSGLLLVARNKHAAGKLTQAMWDGRIAKTYFAVLDGEIASQGGTINACLHRTAQSIIIREICSPSVPDAEMAITVYTVLAVQNGHTLVEAHPLTGRTHQLRVHFASIGHPITGDNLYGMPSPLIARHALHARALTFPHPTTGQDLTFTAPLPNDFQTLIINLFDKIPSNPKQPPSCECEKGESYVR